jgi:cytochrome b561
MTTTALRSRETYSAASKWIHWITAACVLGLIPAGWIMIRLPEGALQNNLFDLHRSFGMTVFVLAFLRVAARQVLGVPAPAETLTRLERIASVSAHHALLALIFIMPLLGWLMMSAYGIAVPIFWLFELPKILPKSEMTYDVLSWAHSMLGYLMAAILVAHVGGALMHGFIKRDGVLDRMLPKVLARFLPR